MQNTILQGTRRSTILKTHLFPKKVFGAFLGFFTFVQNHAENFSNEAELIINQLEENCMPVKIRITGIYK